MRLKHTITNSLLFSLLVLFILMTFQPFGIDTVFPQNEKYPLVFGYGFIAFLSMLVPNLIYKNYFDDKPLYIEIAVFFTTTLLVGHLLGFFFYQHFFTLAFSWELFFEFFLFSGSTVILPFIYYATYIAKNNNKENLSPVKKGKIFVLEGNNRREKISFEEKELLYLKSSKNYVEVYLLKGNEIQRQLLRNTFRNILEQLDNTAIKRVHRSYAVNGERDFTSRKNELVLEELDIKIPVSDSYAKLLENSMEKY